MSNDGKDDPEKTVNFDALELDEGDESSQKMTQLLTYLEENMEPEKYAEVMTLLGVGKDMSNTDLFEKIKGLMKPGEKEEEEEEEDPDKEKDLGEEGEKPDRAAFMKECMAGGKDLATCTEEFKKKYPEPAKEEGAETELSTEVKTELKSLRDELDTLKGQKELAEVSTEVEKLISEKHLAPVQREAIIKMSAKMEPEAREELLDFFRTTQKLNVHRDAGVLPSDKPGGVAGNDLTVERKKELINMFGLDGLIEDKADQTKLGFLKGDN